MRSATRCWALLSVAAVLVAAWLPAGASAASGLQFVRFATPLGNIDVELLPQAAPKTVANFLSYIDRSDASNNYTNTFFERSVSSFVLQGGGYSVATGQIRTITQGATVPNEFGVSNARGTLAMAQPSGQPNGATDEWFFNTVNNGAGQPNDLDAKKFTVFGQIVNPQSLAVMDAIARLPTTTYSQIAAGSFPTPARNWAAGQTPGVSNLVTSNITRLDDSTPPAITVTLPAAGASLTEGETVTPQFSCDDGSGTGVASCAVSQPVETDLIGQHTFTVTATDYAGNTTTKAVDYTVVPTPLPGLPAPISAPAAPELKPGVSPLPSVSIGAVSRTGSVPVALRCPTAAKRACAGTVTFSARVSGRRMSFGSARYRVAGGRRTTLTVRLTRAAVALLRTRHVGQFVTVAVAPAGGRAQLSTRRLALTRH